VEEAKGGTDCGDMRRQEVDVAQAQQNICLPHA